MIHSTGYKPTLECHENQLKLKRGIAATKFELLDHRTLRVCLDIFC